MSFPLAYSPVRRQIGAKAGTATLRPRISLMFGRAVSRIAEMRFHSCLDSARARALVAGAAYVQRGLAIREETSTAFAPWVCSGCKVLWAASGAGAAGVQDLVHCLVRWGADMGVQRVPSAPGVRLLIALSAYFAWATGAENIVKIGQTPLKEGGLNLWKVAERHF